MAQMYDAMTGAELRQQFLAQKAKEEQLQKQKQQDTMVGGEGAAKASGPPKIKQPSELSPHDDAMDFGSPTMATG
jgi:hypothetical protein